MADENKDLANAGGDNGNGNGNGNDNAGGNAGDKGGDKGGDKKPRFTPEDQEYINGLVDEVFARGHKKGSGELTEQLSTAQTQIQALQTELSELKKTAKPAKSDDTDKDKSQAAQLKAQIEELQNNLKTIIGERDSLKQTIEGETKKSRSTQFETTFTETAAELKEKGLEFFNNKQVLKDVREELRHEEDGSITVLNLRTGQPRLNAEMKPFTLGDFLAEYARKNPHMVRAQGVDGGTGSSASQRQQTRDEKKTARQMTNEEFEAFHQKVLSGNAKK